MLRIGLTGGIGSGKSKVANLFAAQGITIIDTDQLARYVILPGKPALNSIIAQWGKDLLLPDGNLDRRKLRNLIFADDEKRIWLEHLLHPLIREEMKSHINNATSPYCIVVIPLLFETEPNPLINRSLVVDTSEEQQIARGTTRDGVSLDEIMTIINSQINRDQRLSLADDVIVNDGTIESLIPKVDQLHHLYLTHVGKSEIR